MGIKKWSQKILSGILAMSMLAPSTVFAQTDNQPETQEKEEKQIKQAEQEKQAKQETEDKKETTARKEKERLVEKPITEIVTKGTVTMYDSTGRIVTSTDSKKKVNSAYTGDKGRVFDMLYAYIRGVFKVNENRSYSRLTYFT